LTPEQAQILALHALTFLAADPTHIAGFLTATGAEPADMRRFARTDEGQAAVLDYLLSDETLLLAFVVAEGCAETDPARARHALPGQTPEADWT